MKELIVITEENGKRAVSARELHAFLESKQEFAAWIKSRIQKYGLVENEDFATFDKIINRENARKQGATKLIEYALTIDCAKELAMVEGNEKGKQARRYFISAEKALRKVEEAAVKTIKSMEDRLNRLEETMNVAQEHEFTVFGYAGLIRKKLYGSEAMTIGKRAAKRCREAKVEPGHVYDARYGMVNVYPEYILRSVFEEFFKNPRF
jgi:phage anti-repressor protein